jgi:hypothetical protein
MRWVGISQKSKRKSQKAKVKGRNSKLETRKWKFESGNLKKGTRQARRVSSGEKDKSKVKTQGRKSEEQGITRCAKGKAHGLMACGFSLLPFDFCVLTFDLLLYA